MEFEIITTTLSYFFCLNSMSNKKHYRLKRFTKYAKNIYDDKI